MSRTAKTIHIAAILHIATALVCLLVMTSAVADEKVSASSERSTQISGKWVFGVETDSNVSVDAIDSDLSASDSLMSIDVNLDLETRFNEKTELRVDASYSHNAYEEFSEFDLTTAFVALDLSHDFGRFTSGVVGRAIIAELDSEDFLSLNQASWYVNSLLSRRAFIYADYTYSEKEFDTFFDRDADVHSMGADLYYFLDGSKRYWVTGYKYEREDAAAAEFDREVHTIKLRYTHSIPLFERTVIARFKARYQVRDYESITPSIGAIREDDRFRIGLELEIPISRNWFAQLEYEHSDYQSNLPAADYDQDIAALRLGWKFGD